MEYDLSAGTIRANLGGKYLESGQYVISNIIRPILQSFILPFYGIKTLHGAVLTKGERTILLTGRGGADKTTTAAQLMRAGYDILSDDGPFFFTDGNHAYALSSLDYLHLTENTLRLFPELKERTVGVRDHREKFAVRMSELPNSGAWKQPLRITHYIQLQRRREVAVPRVEKINRHLIHRTLLDESMIIFRRAPFRASADTFRQYSEFIFDLLAKVVQGAETFELTFADQHLREIPALLEQI